MSSKAQNTSVLIKEPMQVIEVPDKQILLVESSEDESSKRSHRNENSSSIEEDSKKQVDLDMDVTMNEEIPPNNEL